MTTNVVDAKTKDWGEALEIKPIGEVVAVRVPLRGRRLKRWKRRHNTTHARIRCLGERAMATLKGWRLLRKLRCSTNRITDVVKAFLALHHASA